MSGTCNKIYFLLTLMSEGLSTPLIPRRRGTRLPRARGVFPFRECPTSEECSRSEECPCSENVPLRGGGAGGCPALSLRSKFFLWAVIKIYFLFGGEGLSTPLIPRRRGTRLPRARGVFPFCEVSFSEKFSRSEECPCSENVPLRGGGAGGGLGSAQKKQTDAKQLSWSN